MFSGENGVFSETNKIIDDPSFQINSMIEKIKKVKVENPKKIELLVDINEREPAIEPVSETKSSSDNKEVVIEGLLTTTGIYEYKPEEYTGFDYVNDNGEGEITDPRQILIHFINRLYNNVIEYENYIAKEITQILSGGNATPNDVNLIQDNINWFLCIVISIFVVYNWYYISLYEIVKKDDAGETYLEKPEITHFDTDYLLNLKEKNIFIRYLYPFISPAYTIFSWVDNILTVKLNSIKNVLFYKELSKLNDIFFMLEYTFIIVTINKIIKPMKDLVIGLLSMNIVNIYQYPVSTLFTFLAVIICMSKIVMFIIDNLSIILDVAKIMPFNIMFAVIFGIVSILYIGICSFITPFIAIFLITIYIIFFSLFAIFHYSNYDPAASMEKVKNINDSISLKKFLFVDTSCTKRGLWETMVYYCTIFLQYVDIYKFYLTIVYFLTFTIVEYFLLIETPTLKTNLIIVNTISILIILIYTMQDMMKEIDTCGANVIDITIDRMIDTLDDTSSNTTVVSITVLILSVYIISIFYSFQTIASNK